MLSYQAMYYLVSGEVPQPQGRGHDSIPTYRSFTCADGVDIVITANTEKMWHAVCRALERPELAEDARFLNGRLRYENRHALWDLLESAFAAEQAAALLPRLLAHGVPAAQINTIADALVDPQVEHRRMVRPVAHPGGDLVTRFLGNPIKFGPEVEPQWPSELGADTERVLRDLAGMSDADLAELQADDVIAPPPLPASAVTSEEGQERGTSSAGSGRRSIRRGRRHSQDRRGVK
jgi:crotonobetainyl-CoA:carnitine CoA-transferase CaiB-like acyl-CoA transferase